MTIKAAMNHIGCSRNTLMRYKKQGLLSAKLDSQGKLQFDPKEIRKIAVHYDDNRDRNKVKGHLPDVAPTPRLTKNEIKRMEERDQKAFHSSVAKKYEDDGDNPALLNDYGEQELMRVTQRLRDMGILDMVDMGVINRYAVALQMQQKYLVKHELDEGNMIYIKLYETFTRQVTNYEKELGLTAASASKLNIKEKAPVDEMESFLNNG